MAEMQREKFLSLLGMGECTVVFTKQDGSTRRMRCTLREELINDEPVRDTPPEHKRKVNEDTCVVWDLDKKDWRSFRVDSVIDFLSPE